MLLLWVIVMVVTRVCQLVWGKCYPVSFDYNEVLTG